MHKLFDSGVWHNMIDRFTHGWSDRLNWTLFTIEERETHMQYGRSIGFAGLVLAFMAFMPTGVPLGFEITYAQTIWNPRQFEADRLFNQGL